jgi:hypothetical protein
MQDFRNPSSALRLVMKTMAVVVSAVLLVACVSWTRLIVVTASYHGTGSPTDYGRIAWDFDVRAMRVRCTALVSDAPLPSPAKEVFAGEEALFREFIALHEKSHCLAGDELQPVFSETGMWRAETVADIFAANMLIARHGVPARGFVRKWNLVRTASWMGGDTFHWSTPALSAFLSLDNGFGDDEKTVIGKAEEFVVASLGNREMPQPDSVRMAFLTGGDGSVEQTEKWRLAVASPDFAGTPSLQEIAGLRVFFGTSDWRRIALGRRH